MGAMAEAIAACAQPLLDNTDGSAGQMNHALALGTLCWNLALVPEEERDKVLREMGPSLEMKEHEFENFKRSVVLPMIRRHQEMFPNLHRRDSTVLPQRAPVSQTRPSTAAGTGRNAPCPCNSGKKYKRCCGR